MHSASPATSQSALIPLFFLTTITRDVQKVLQCLQKFLQRETDLKFNSFGLRQYQLQFFNYLQLLERNGLDAVLLYAINLHASLHYKLTCQFDASFNGRAFFGVFSLCLIIIRSSLQSGGMKLSAIFPIISKSSVLCSLLCLETDWNIRIGKQGYVFTLTNSVKK